MRLFSERLQECALRAGSKVELAKVSGVSFSQLMRYLNGSSKPTLPKIEAIAKSVGVSAGWLAGGDENTGKYISQVLIDQDVFIQVVQKVEAVLANTSKAMSPERKGIFIFAVCKAAEQAAREEKDFLLSERSLVEMMDFMTVFPDDNDVKELYKAIEFLPKEIDQAKADEWISIICCANREFYNTQSGQRYFDRVPNIEDVYAQEISRVLAKVDAISPAFRDILDIGCGNGRHLKFIHDKNNGWNLKGVDSSIYAIQLCRHIEVTGQLPEGTVQQADIRKIPLPSNSFDLIIARNSLFCVPLTATGKGGLDDVFAEISRLLRPGGVFHGMTRYGTGITFYQAHQLLDEPTLKLLCARHGLHPMGMRVVDVNASINIGTPQNNVHNSFKDFISFEVVKPRTTNI